MTADDCTPDNGENVAVDSESDSQLIDRIADKMAAAFAARLERMDYDLENVDQWNPMEGGTYNVGPASPIEVTGSARGKHAEICIEKEDLGQKTRMDVFYTVEGVHTTIEGEGEDTRVGALATLNPDEAREAAFALYQAAEEQERRQTAEEGDDE